MKNWLFSLLAESFSPKICMMLKEKILFFAIWLCLLLYIWNASVWQSSHISQTEQRTINSLSLKMKNVLKVFRRPAGHQMRWQRFCGQSNEKLCVMSTTMMWYAKPAGDESRISPKIAFPEQMGWKIAYAYSFEKYQRMLLLRSQTLMIFFFTFYPLSSLYYEWKRKHRTGRSNMFALVA